MNNTNVSLGTQLLNASITPLFQVTDDGMVGTGLQIVSCFKIEEEGFMAQICCGAPGGNGCCC